MPLTIKQRQRLERLVRQLDNKEQKVIPLDYIKRGTLIDRAKVKSGDTFMNTILLLAFVIFILGILWAILIKKP
jgi:hypothetical protein